MAEFLQRRLHSVKQSQLGSADGCHSVSLQLISVKRSAMLTYKTDSSTVMKEELQHTLCVTRLLSSLS